MLNADRLVNSGDQGMLGLGVSGAVPYHPNMNLNKDGSLNSGDQGFLGSYLGGQCP